jgi:hypothetical protein
MTEIDVDIGIVILKAVKSALSERPGGFDEPAFREWFKRVGCDRFFRRPLPSGSEPKVIHEIADCMARESKDANR